MRTKLVTSIYKSFAKTLNIDCIGTSQLIRNQQVAGSTPVASSLFFAIGIKLVTHVHI